MRDTVDLLEKAFDTGYDAGLYRGFERASKMFARPIAKPTIMRFAEFIGDPENTPSPTLATATNPGFNYVDIVSNGCEGWINLFFGEQILCMISDVDLAKEIKSVTAKRQDSLIGPEG